MDINTNNILKKNDHDKYNYFCRTGYGNTLTFIGNVNMDPSNSHQNHYYT
jgi:hypothetical protein